MQQLVAAAFNTGTSEGQSVILSKDGTQIPCFLTGVRVVLDGGPCILGIALDLRKLNQAEMSLRAAEEQHRSLIWSRNPAHIRPVHAV